MKTNNKEALWEAIEKSHQSSNAQKPSAEGSSAFTNQPDNIDLPALKCEEAVSHQPSPVGEIAPTATNGIDVIDTESCTLEISPVSILECPQALDPLSFPHKARPGSTQLPSTLENIDHLLNANNIIVRYNVIRKQTEVLGKEHSGSIDNANNVGMTQIISLAALNGLSVGQIPYYVETLADRNPYNPVANWIKSKPWDGKDRLPEVYDTIVEREGYPKHLKIILIFKWLLSAVAAVLMGSGFRSRGVLTLQGPQGVGKTSWVVSLINDPLLRETTIKVDHHLDGGNKDSILGAIRHWIVEIGELDSSFRKDISRLKGFLTSNSDKVRRPYARTESEYPRRTIFFASVNKHDFLIDNTGNSRWWTIPVEKINYKHNIDMQQVFAQLAEAFYQGEQWWLTQEEEDLLEHTNGEHRSISVIHERLMAATDPDLAGKEGNPAMTALEVLEKLGFDKPTNALCKECASILRELYGESKRIKGLNKWRIPLRRSSKTFQNLDDLY